MKVYKTTDYSLPWYDFSTLNAIAACPRKGIIQYRYNKHMPGHTASEALSAGTAMHKFFAAWHGYNKPELLKSFDETTLHNMHACASLANTEDEARLVFAMSVFDDYDERDDRRKSLANLQRSACYWVEMQKHRWEVVGVEVPFDVTIEFEDKEQLVPYVRGDGYEASWDPVKLRYVGIIDCVARTHDGGYFSVEYKTTSRITDAYRSQWILSPQLTGYNLALQAIYGRWNVTRYSVLEAVTLPMPKTPGTAPIYMCEQFPRRKVQLDVFEDFVYNSVSLANQYEANPVTARAQPSACNDYNSVCQFLPFCSMDEEDRQVVFNEEMVVSEWNPTKVL